MTAGCRFGVSKQKWHRSETFVCIDPDIASVRIERVRLIESVQRQAEPMQAKPVVRNSRFALIEMTDNLRTDPGCANKLAEQRHIDDEHAV